MYVNFLRTGVVVESIDHLYEIQHGYRQMKIAGKNHAFLSTRRTPVRANDLLNGGSVYWIINRQICARQQIIDIQTLKDENDKNFCRIIMDQQIHMTNPVAHRHIQGWRYLTPEKAPADLRLYDPNDIRDDIDPQLAEELSAAGLL
jgi:hypothetical protein